MCVLLAVLCCGGGIRWHCSAGDCGAAAEAVRRDGGAAARPPIAARRGANPRDATQRTGVTRRPPPPCGAQEPLVAAPTNNMEQVLPPCPPPPCPLACSQSRGGGSFPPFPPPPLPSLLALAPLALAPFRSRKLVRDTGWAAAMRASLALLPAAEAAAGRACAHPAGSAGWAGSTCCNPDLLVTQCCTAEAGGGGGGRVERAGSAANNAVCAARTQQRVCRGRGVALPPAISPSSPPAGPRLPVRAACHARTRRHCPQFSQIWVNQMQRARPRLS